MKVNAQLDFDVIAVEQDDVVTVMLELTAPTLAPTKRRPPASVQVVLDRSGSMSGGRLEAAKQALLRLVDRLGPDDRLGVVAFDDEVQVPVPAGSVGDHAAARHAVAGLQPGGSTNLSGGLLRGVQEARRGAGQTGTTLLLVSDGHANAGEVDPARLAAVAAKAREHGVATSTIGIGLGYDETLLSELARGGQGNHAFAEHADDATAAIAAEVEGLLSKTVQAASLLVRPDGPVEAVTVWNDLPAAAVQDGIMVELGDLWSGEQRRLVLSFAVPAKPALGLAEVASLELRYVAVPELVEKTVTIPVHVNVVPGDHAAGRIPDATVRTELVFQQTQVAKRRAADALRDGDLGRAGAAYDVAYDRLVQAAAAAPSPELDDELRVLRDLRSRSDAGEALWAAKYSRMDSARKSRRRGRDV